MEASPFITARVTALGKKLFSSQADQEAFVERFALVSDTVFGFLSETATEVVARIALEDNTKNVRNGGLWYEEAVPAESLFYGFAITQAFGNIAPGELEATLKSVNGQAIQIGGNATVGRGLCRVRVDGVRVDVS